MAHYYLTTTDPAEYGWLYQGRNETSRVDFWQNAWNGEKIDFYYTTGTVKTSMNHPRQGKTQLFRRGLSESEFRAILTNPRQHTGKGYQSKSSKYYRKPGKHSYY